MVIHGRGAAAPGPLGSASSLQPGRAGSSRLPGKPFPTSLPHGGCFLREGSKTSPQHLLRFTVSCAHALPFWGDAQGDWCPLGCAARVGRWGEHFNADTLQVAATKMGATISLTGNCNTFPILLIFTVFVGLFSFQNLCLLVLHSESFSHFCFALVKEQCWAIFLVISLFLPAFFYMFSSCLQIPPHAAGRASPGRASPAGSAARDRTQDCVQNGDLALDQSWKQLRPQTFLRPAGEKKKAIAAACDLQVPRGPWQATLFVQPHSPHL